MAVVLEALASNLSNVLAKMARKEVGMLLGISDKIDSLRVRLDGLKEFLADAERRRITDLHVQGWVKELKDAMYDATDILELCQLKAMDQDSRRSNNPSLLSLRNPLNAHHIGSRIMALNQRLDGIKQRAEQFSFIKLDRYGDCSRTAQGHGLRRTTPELDRSGVVGNKIEQDTRRLVELLTREEEEASAASISSNVRVVAIVGVGGIGKTTLAQNIFNHQDIKEKFDKIIWLSINQEFSDPELVRTAITGAGGEHSGHQELSLLQPILREAISGKKIFLVMDDMWSVHAWNNSLRIPLVNSAAQGSWVLITTRDERVAREMKAIQPYHRVDILSRQDAWLLLKKQMGSSSSKDEWCSLEELGPLSQLRDLHIKGLENVSASSSAAKAMLGAKKHLAIWWLECTDRQRDDGFLKEEGIISIDEQRRIKEVFDELCPSYCLEQLYIRGYFGWQLPKWMTSKASVRLDRLTSLKLDGLPCCTKLPDGLCQLSCLKLLQIRRAPAIERIGHEFLQIQQHNGDCHPSRAAVAFPILETLEFTVVLELEEWVWEEHIQAMPLLHELTLDRCKLRQLPLGLAENMPGL
ncbi:disease resistance RPP13-like protein 4 isoform X2 [Oryza sativa Japonica Group]|uniref:disease resistance RPP13-like protein 4 isoform X2 n=1 Tax=Oryza sativa subsp. japonica TaxID=39947 RepID=UPI0007754377